MSKVARVEVLSIGSRRRWTLDEKRRIIAESFDGPRRVSETARRHGLSASQLFTWRRLARQGRLAAADAPPGFASAMITDDGAADDSAGCALLPDPAPCEDRPSPPTCPIGTPGRIEIVLVCGRRVIVEPDIDVAVLARLIAAVEPA